MSENNQEKEGKKPPFGGSGKPPGKPRFGFSIYWIYAIIAIVFISLQFISLGGGTSELDMKSFLEMVSANEVEKVTVVNETKAEITIRSNALNKDKFAKVRERG